MRSGVPAGIVAYVWTDPSERKSKTMVKPKPLLKPPAPAPAQWSTRDFYLDDFAKALFPLETNQVLIQSGEQQIKQFIAKCLAEEPGYSFLAQTRVYAAKPGLHLRRTVKLDVVAEYFLYDLVYRNRARFRKAHLETRQHFGYRFVEGRPLPPSQSYKAFKGAIAASKKTYKHFLSFDISSFFNSIYHHDLVAWLANLGASDDDYAYFGKFLRETNSGRSIDCLVQGLYPSKMVGNDFLRYIDEHHSLRSGTLLRFMDDIYLFSDSSEVLQRDFIYIQKLLGDRGLSVNPSKTIRDIDKQANFDDKLDDVKSKLLQRRRRLVTESYDDEPNVINIKLALNKDELAYLTALLAADNIDEEDAELVLTLMREHDKLVHKRLPDIAVRFPHLAKSIFNFCKHVKDIDFLAEMIETIVRDRSDLQEYQLFWFGWILQSYLMNTTKASNIIDLLYNHPNATMISRAKILEIADVRFGLTELRDQQLGAGQSDWLAWASAVGHRSLRSISRNHRFSYFAKSSPINKLIADIVGQI